MDVSQTREKLTTVLTQIGMNEDTQYIFVYMLEPLIEDYVMGLFSTTFTDEETKEIVDGVVEDKRLDMKDIAGILFVEYKKKTGKSIEEEIDSYINFITEDIKRIFKQYNLEVDKLKALPPEERAAKMLEEISKPLDFNLDVE